MKPDAGLLTRFLGLAVCVLASGGVARADTLVVSADGQTRSLPGHFAPGSVESIQVKNRIGPRGRHHGSDHGRDHGHEADYRGFLRFDLSSLPDGATIDKAVLRLWASDVDHAGTVDVLPVLEAWETDPGGVRRAIG
jgi:hypothetical protein